MAFRTKQSSLADDVRKVALAGLSSIVGDGKEDARSKPGLTAVRAVATGAVLYTAGRAVVTGRHLVRDLIGADGHEAKDDDVRDEELDDEDYEEPEAEEDDDLDDEDYEEPEAEEDEESRRSAA